jgi:hypothetical protein
MQRFELDDLAVVDEQTSRSLMRPPRSVRHVRTSSVIPSLLIMADGSMPPRTLRLRCDQGRIVIFAKALAKQHADKGIRINAVAFPPISSPLQLSGGHSPTNFAEFGTDVFSSSVPDSAASFLEWPVLCEPCRERPAQRMSANVLVRGEVIRLVAADQEFRQLRN